MRVLVFASQKGGGGKTTLSGHIAVEAERHNEPGGVVMIDMDPQASLTGWFRERGPETPALVRLLPMGLGATLDELRAAGIGLVVIDTPPAITEAIRETCRLADLVVVPTKPSPHDLRAVGATVDIVDSVGKPLTFVVNQATQRARITADAAIALSQHGTVAPVTVHHRVDFPSSMIDGRVVVELDAESKSATEITALWLYLSARLTKVTTNVAAASLTAQQQPAHPQGPGAGNSEATLGPGSGSSDSGDLSPPAGRPRKAATDRLRSTTPSPSPDRRGSRKMA